MQLAHQRELTPLCSHASGQVDGQGGNNFRSPSRQLDSGGNLYSRSLAEI